MSRELFLELASQNRRMPIGTDLVLHLHSDAADLVNDGTRLGQVVEEAANMYGTQLAFPLMDLKLEKRCLLELMEVQTDDPDSYHFSEPPSEEALERFNANLSGPLNPRLQSHIDSVGYIASNTDLYPIGMSIGPFSLTTKLLADPITPIFLAGSGFSADDEDEIATLEAATGVALQMVLRSIQAQIHAGAKAVFIAEPAANLVFFSPNQMEEDTSIFDRFVMQSNREVKSLLQGAGADLVFHCCGELMDEMVKQFASLDPVLLSLGSSRKLWEDAAIVPKNIVLFGNLPSKKFYSDAEITREQVEQMACELVAKMEAAGHPFILGSECDVLSVPGAHDTIVAKVDTFMRCSCG